MSLTCEAEGGTASDSSPGAADMSEERGAGREGRKEWRHEVGGRRSEAESRRQEPQEAKTR